MAQQRLNPQQHLNPQPGQHPQHSEPWSAEYPLIRQYLLTVDPVIRHRTDAADLRDELADHLIEAAERLKASGVDSETAERRSLDRFGEPALIARLIDAVPMKGHPMHTTFSRAASFFAVAAALLWTTSAVLIYISQQNSFVVDVYAPAVALVCAALAASGVTLLSLHVQMTGRFDAPAGVVVALLVLAIAAAFVAAWAVLPWLILLLAATVITLFRVRATAVGTGAPFVLLGIVWPSLTVAVLVLALYASGPLSPYANPLLATFEIVAIPIVCLIYAVGNVVLAVRMRALIPHEAAHDDSRGPYVSA